MARTNIDIDNQLMKEGMKRMKCHTKKALVHMALLELITRHRQKDMLDLAGKVRWEGDLKAWRKDR